MQILIKNIHSLPMDIEWKVKNTDKKRWEKIASIKQEADKKRSYASFYLLQKMCKRINIVNPVYGYQINGKPYLLNEEVVAFNISHSGDYAVLAYQKKNEPLGIDIQQIRPMRNGMERRVLFEGESMPEGLEQEERNQCLTRIWAIKESYVKMTGEGLACDFRNLYIDFERKIIRAKDGKTARFMEWEWNHDYVIALCTTSMEECELEEC